MNWLIKVAKAISINSIGRDLYNAIKYMVGDITQFFPEPKTWLAADDLQKYQVYHFTISKPISTFYIDIYVSVRRAKNMTEMPDPRNKEDQQLWRKNNPLEEVTTYDSKIGHPLVKFMCVIKVRNKKPSNSYRTISYYRTIAADSYIDTPWEVAKFIQEKIENYPPDDDSGNEGEDDNNTWTPGPYPEVSTDDFTPSPSNII